MAAQLENFANQKTMLVRADRELNEQRETISKLKRDLDQSIVYEVKGGRLQIRSALASSSDDPGVHDPRSAGSGVSDLVLKPLAHCLAPALFAFHTNETEIVSLVIVRQGLAWANPLPFMQRSLISNTNPQCA